MKTRFLVVFLASALALIAAATANIENLINNGDFSRGGGWRGDGRIGKPNTNEENKAYIVGLGGKPKSFEQTVMLNGRYNSIELTYRAMASDDYKPANDGIASFSTELRQKPSPGSYRSNDVTLSEKGKWKNCKIRWECPNAKELNIKIILRPGSGDIYFDDFVLTGK